MSCIVCYIIFELSLIYVEPCWKRHLGTSNHEYDPPELYRSCVNDHIAIQVMCGLQIEHVQMEKCRGGCASSTKETFFIASW